MSPQCLSLALQPVSPLDSPRAALGVSMPSYKTRSVKSQNLCPKPGQMATILWLSGSRETACGNAASPAQRAEKPTPGWTKLFPRAPTLSSRAPTSDCPTAALGIRQRLALGSAVAPAHAAGRRRFLFTFPKRIFNMLESFILRNGARNKSQGPRFAPAQSSSWMRSQLSRSIRAGGHPGQGHLATRPFAQGAQSWQASLRVRCAPRRTATHLVPKESLSWARRHPNSASK